MPNVPSAGRGVFHRALPYVLSIASVAAALYGSFILERADVRNMAFPLLLFAIATQAGPSVAWHVAPGF
jgi:hypothetical protein